MSPKRDVRVSRLELLLSEAVHQRTFPGAVAALARRGSTGAFEHWFACAGDLEPDGEPTEIDSIYDLASLTKPFVATSALRLAQQSVLDMHVPVEEWLPELAGTTGGGATLSALLSHRAGLSPWGGLFRDAKGPAGSAQTKRFMLREAATRVDEKPPAQGSVYSDLGYLVAGEAIARAAGKPLDQVVREQVTEPLAIERDVYYAASLSRAELEQRMERIAPTERCGFRERVVRGEVHDENCAVFGGVAGHAGLFGTAGGVLAFGMAMLDALEGRSLWLDQAIVRWALRPRPGGGHVVGWDTKSAEGSSAGTLFSPQSFGHLGFTGTSIWCDPTRALCAVLLSNRVHPTRDNIQIREFRPRFHDEIVRLVE